MNFANHKPQNFFLSLILMLFTVGCEPEIRVVDFEAAMVNLPEVCTTDLTIESLAGSPCLIGAIDELRNAEPETQVGCVHVRHQDQFDSLPLQVFERNDHFGLDAIGALDIDNIDGGLEIILNVRVQYLFIPNSTPETCDAMGINDSCATIEGCSFGLGPVVPLGRQEYPGLGMIFPVTGQGPNDECVYQMPDGLGLIHPEVCDGRDNDCNGQIDDAPMCMPEPEPEPEPECEESRDCNIDRPLCIDGQCRGCEPGLLECDALTQPVCDVSGVCRGCQANSECGEGLSCDVATGICVQCQTDIDCPMFAPFCSSSGQCEGCNPLQSGQCSEGQTCLADGSCGACQSNDQCPANSPLCNGESGLCEGCVSSSDCADGLLCNDNQCRECASPGASVTQCPQPSAPICDGETFSCRPCNNDEECGEGVRCYLGQCRNCNPLTNQGCEGTNRICDPNVLSCSSCQSNEQCRSFFPQTPICSTGTGQCAQCELGSNLGCTAENPVCKITNDGLACQPCENNADCTNAGGAVCDDGQCVACNSDNDCNPGEKCANINGTRTCAPCDPEQPVGQNGCSDVTMPFCTSNGICGACLTNAECPTQSPICGADNQCRTCLGDAECVMSGLVCGNGICATCDASRSAPDNPGVDFGCTPEQPNCQFGGTRCRP